MIGPTIRQVTLGLGSNQRTSLAFLENFCQEMRSMGAPDDQIIGLENYGNTYYSLRTEVEVQ